LGFGAGEAADCSNCSADSLDFLIGSSGANRKSSSDASGLRPDGALDDGLVDPLFEALPARLAGGDARPWLSERLDGLLAGTSLEVGAAVGVRGADGTLPVVGWSARSFFCHR
jgi:hypothetical protein